MNHLHRCRRLCRLVLFLLPWLVWLMGGPPAARAAKTGNDFGMRLLQAQLPIDGSLRRLDVDHLVSTVRAATHAHRRDAVAILAAALTLDEWDARRKKELPLSCPVVALLFRTSARVAPEYTAALLETAEALYPECADPLTVALQALESKNVATVSEPNAIGSSPVGSSNGADPNGNGDPNGGGDPNSNGDPNGGGDPNSNGDPNGGSSNGSSPSGGGLGPGFPGSPGFGGSSPAGGFALPTPLPTPVTSFVNN